MRPGAWECRVGGRLSLRWHEEYRTVPISIALALQREIDPMRYLHGWFTQGGYFVFCDLSR